MNDRPQTLGFFAAVLESARQTIALSARGRAPRLVVGAMLAAAAVAWLIAGRRPEGLDGRNLYCQIAWWLYGTAVMPWATLFLGVQAVHGRIEDRTFVYLFLRPVGRVPLLLGTWLASVVMAGAVVVFGVLVLFAAVAARSQLWPDGIEWALAGDFALVMGLGVVAYAAIAALFAAAFRHPLIWSAGFAVGVQAIAANLPVSAGLRRMTITDPLRRIMLDRIEPDPRLAQDLWPAERDFRSELIGHPFQDLAVLVLVALVLAAWIYCRAEFDSRERE